MLEKFDHPIFFVLALTLVVTASQQILAAGAKKMGWTGIANFFGKK